MPKRVPVQAIHVQREGKTVVPKIGEVFDFTAEELKDINDLNPGAVSKVESKDIDDAAEAKAQEEAARKANEEAARKDAEAKAKLAADKKPAGKAGADSL